MNGLKTELPQLKEEVEEHVNLTGQLGDKDKEIDKLKTELVELKKEVKQNNKLAGRLDEKDKALDEKEKQLENLKKRGQPVRCSRCPARRERERGP